MASLVEASTVLRIVRRVMETAEDDSKREALADVLLCVEDGCVFEKHQGAMDRMHSKTFQPILVDFRKQAVTDGGFVVCNVAPPVEWLDMWNLSGFSQCWFKTEDQVSKLTTTAAALMARLDEPPLHASPFWIPPDVTPFLIRKHKIWCARSLWRVDELAHCLWGHLQRRSPRSEGLFHCELMCKRCIRPGS